MDKGTNETTKTITLDADAAEMALILVESNHPMCAEQAHTKKGAECAGCRTVRLLREALEAPEAPEPEEAPEAPEAEEAPEATKAIITHKRISLTTHPQTGRRFYTCLVECSGCGHSRRYGFAGWCGLMCSGCGAEMERLTPAEMKAEEAEEAAKEIRKNAGMVAGAMEAAKEAPEQMQRDCDNLREESDRMGGEDFVVYAGPGLDEPIRLGDEVSCSPVVMTIHRSGAAGVATRARVNAGSAEVFVVWLEEGLEDWVSAAYLRKAAPEEAPEAPEAEEAAPEEHAAQ